MKLIISILLFCPCKYVIGTPSPQQTKLGPLKSLGFNISKATMTLNSNDLNQLLNLLKSMLYASKYCSSFSFILIACKTNVRNYM